MTSVSFARLAHRSLIAVGGDDRQAFLQGLVSADIPRVSQGQALYGAFLTAQGRFLHEFFAAELGSLILLETETERRADFIKRLSMYKLRSKVTIAAYDALSVAVAFGDGVEARLGAAVEPGRGTLLDGGLAFPDPRLAGAGLRLWLPEAGIEALAEKGLTETQAAAWDQRRIGLGLPDGSRDMIPDKAFLLENGFDELGGVDWNKGCFLGQELTARTKYRALIKKRLLPVAIEGEAPPFGTPITKDGVEVGEMRSSSGQVGLALLRLEHLDPAAPQALATPTARLTPGKPGWASF